MVTDRGFHAVRGAMRADAGITVIGKERRVRPRRGRCSKEERARIVAQCCRPGASLQVLARRHGVTIETLRRWVGLAGRLGEVNARDAGPLPAFVPLVLEEQALPRADDDAGAWRCRASDCRWFGHFHPGPGSVNGALAEIDPAMPTRIVLATRTVLFAKQHDGLAAVMELECGLDPFSGMAAVFRCARRDAIKVLWWEGRSLMVVHKRLEHGRFVWPPVHEGAIHLSPEKFELLFAGLDWRRMLSPRVIRRVEAV